MPLKETCHEFCPYCGQRMHTLGARYVSFHGDCLCVVPGPPSPPRKFEKTDVMFVPGTPRQLQVERDAKKPVPNCDRCKDVGYYSLNREIVYCDCVNGNGFGRDAAFLRPGDAKAEDFSVKVDSVSESERKIEATIPLKPVRPIEHAGIMPNHNGVDDCRTVGVEGKVELPDDKPTPNEPLGPPPLYTIPHPAEFMCCICGKTRSFDKRAVLLSAGSTGLRLIHTNGPSMCGGCVYDGLLWAAIQASKTENKTAVQAATAKDLLGAST